MIGSPSISRVAYFSMEVALNPAMPTYAVGSAVWQWAPSPCSGVDVWLNTPKRPQEASGSSGMKAAPNGVPSLSILDGWWIEGVF